MSSAQTPVAKTASRTSSPKLTGARNAGRSLELLAFTQKFHRTGRATELQVIALDIESGLCAQPRTCVDVAACCTTSARAERGLEKNLQESGFRLLRGSVLAETEAFARTLKLKARPC